MILIAHVRSLSMLVARKTGTRDGDTLAQMSLDLPVAQLPAVDVRGRRSRAGARASER